MKHSIIIVTLLLPHISSHVIHLFIFIFFSLFKLFFPLFSKKKEKRKKTLVLPIRSHTYYYTSFNLSFSFLPFYLSTTLPLYFLHFLYFYFDSSSTYFILYKIKCEYSLSLGEFLFFLITLIKVVKTSFDLNPKQEWTQAQKARTINL